MYAHKKSDGTNCAGCPDTCSDRELGIQIGGIEIRGCCAMRGGPHGPITFDEDGALTNVPNCCVGYSHSTGQVNPDICGGHGGKPEWAIKVSNVVAAIPEDAPSVDFIVPGRIGLDSPLLTAGLDIKVLEREGDIETRVQGRGFQKLKNGTVVKSPERQPAEKKVEAKAKKVHRTLQELNGLKDGEDERPIIASRGKVIRGGVGWDENSGTVFTEAIVLERRINPHNPDPEWHHRAPTGLEIAEIRSGLGKALGIN